MSAKDKAVVSLRESIEVVEEAYEFMLAYAAQGRQTESETEGASQIRGFLTRFDGALDTIISESPTLGANSAPGAAFFEHFSRDCHTMKSVLGILLDHDNVTSDMIDNTNGMIAVRSFLTDLFFIDQVVLPSRDG